MINHTETHKEHIDQLAEKINAMYGIEILEFGRGLWYFTYPERWEHLRHLVEERIYHLPRSIARQMDEGFASFDEAVLFLADVLDL